MLQSYICYSHSCISKWMCTMYAIISRYVQHLPIALREEENLHRSKEHNKSVSVWHLNGIKCQRSLYFKSGFMRSGYPIHSVLNNCLMSLLWLVRHYISIFRQFLICWSKAIVFSFRYRWAINAGSDESLNQIPKGDIENMCSIDLPHV